MAKKSLTKHQEDNINNIPPTQHGRTDNKNPVMKPAKRSRKSVPRDFPTQRSSIFRGVTRHRWTGRYEAHLWDKNRWNESQNKKGRQVYLGAYEEEEAAARAYDLAALKYWGHQTQLNFPLTSYSREINEMQGLSKEEYIGSLRRKSSGFSRGVSKYRGVARHHHNGRWEARIGRVFGNKYLYLGTYATQEEAATAYDMAAIEYRGLNAVTNFDLSRYMECLKPNHAAANSAAACSAPIMDSGTVKLELNNLINDNNSNGFEQVRCQFLPVEQIPSANSESDTVLGSLYKETSNYNNLPEQVPRTNYPLAKISFAMPQSLEIILDQRTPVAESTGMLLEANQMVPTGSFDDDIRTYNFDWSGSGTSFYGGAGFDEMNGLIVGDHVNHVECLDAYCSGDDPFAHESHQIFSWADHEYHS